MDKPSDNEIITPEFINSIVSAAHDNGFDNVTTFSSTDGKALKWQ